MILESLKKYDLLDRFLQTVKSFTNGLNLAKANANTELENYSLRKLSQFLNKTEETTNNNNNNSSTAANKNNIAQQPTTTVETTANSQASNAIADNTNVNIKQTASHNNARNYNYEARDFDGSASVRAKLAFEVALQLSNTDLKKETSSQTSANKTDSSLSLDKLLNALQPFAQTIASDINELQTQNENLERQNSFRPVFIHYFKSTLYHRVRAVKFRIILAEHGYDLQSLNAIWTEQKLDGLLQVFQTLEKLKEEDKTELANLFDSYFDPTKMTIRPAVKTNNNNNRRRRRGKFFLHIHVYITN